MTSFNAESKYLSREVKFHFFSLKLSNLETKYVNCHWQNGPKMERPALVFFDSKNVVGKTLEAEKKISKRKLDYATVRVSGVLFESLTVSFIESIQ